MTRLGLKVDMKVRWTELSQIKATPSAKSIFLAGVLSASLILSGCAGGTADESASPSEAVTPTPFDVKEAAAFCNKKLYSFIGDLSTGTKELRANPSNPSGIEKTNNLIDQVNRTIPEAPPDVAKQLEGIRSYFESMRGWFEGEKMNPEPEVAEYQRPAREAIALCEDHVMDAIHAIAEEAGGKVIESTPKDPKVTYRVSGASSASLTLTSKNGGTVQHSNKSIPWSTSFRSPSGSQLYISAQNSGSGKITCEILLDGKRLVKNTSTGAYAIATCNSTTP